MELECIFCRTMFLIETENRKYILHLGQYHQIKYDMTHVLERTFKLQEYSTANMDASTNNYEKDIDLVGNPLNVDKVDSPKSVLPDDFNRDTLFDDDSDDNLIIDESINESGDYFNCTETNSTSAYLNKVNGDSTENKSELAKEITNKNLIFQSGEETVPSSNTMEKDIKNEDAIDINSPNTDIIIKMEMDDTIDMDAASMSDLLEDSTSKDDFLSARIRCIKEALNRLGDNDEGERTLDGKDTDKNCDNMDDTESDENQETCHDDEEDGWSDEENDTLGGEDKDDKMWSDSVSERDHLSLNFNQKEEDKARHKRKYDPSSSEESKITRDPKSPRLELKEDEIAEDSTLFSVSIKVEEPDFYEPPQIKQEYLPMESNDQVIQSPDFNLTPVSIAKTIPWFNGTLYSCQHCSNQFIDESSFKLHIESSHEEYHEQYGNESIQITLHECEECGQGVNWNRESIGSHLMSQHNMNLDDYYERNKGDIDLQLNTKNGLDSWANRCIYKCNLCGRTFKCARDEFERHISTAHNMLMVEYTKEHGESMEHEEKLSCHIENCNSQIKWEKGSINFHLKLMHNSMSLQDYERKYMSTYSEKEIDINSFSNLQKEIDINSFSHLQTHTWANRCSFKCSLCGIDVNDKERFKYHLKTKHNFSFKEYNEKFGRTMSHEEKHRCQVENCNSLVWWDKSSIYTHLRLHDKMSLEEYENKYMSNYCNTEKEVAKNTDTDIEWSNRCIFKCAECQKEFNSHSKFGTHLMSHHQLTITDYTKEHGKSIFYEQKHSCQLESCNASMLWDRSRIVNHLRSVHGNMSMSIEDYKIKYMDNYVEKETSDPLNLSSNQQTFTWANRCLFKCHVCQIEVNSKHGFDYHIKTKHSLLVSEYTKQFGRTMSHEEKHSCQVENCNSFIWWDKQTIYSHLREVHDKMSLEEYEQKYMSNYQEKELADGSFNVSKTNVDIEWSNKCTFQCAACQREFDSRSRFGTHLKSQHQLSVTEYTKLHGKSIFHEEKHSCQVESCDACIIWDRSSIKSHLSNCHPSMSIEDYKTKYMDNYVDKEKGRISNMLNLSTNTDYLASWANRCIYKCIICGKTFNNSRQNFERHVSAVHKMMMGDYTKEHGKTMEHEEKHSCQIDNCNSIITWEKGCINVHLKSVHDSMSLQNYEIKYMKNYSEKDNSSSSNTSWANKCIYKCDICGTTKLNSRYEFERHMPSIHDITVGEYTKQHGKTMEHEEKHFCQVEFCSSKITWEKDCIKAHLKSVHDSMSLQDYETKYMNNYKEKGQKSPNNSQASSWANKCIFKCSICEMEVNNRSTFEYHLKTKHNLAVGDYTKEHGKTLSYEEKHSCQIENCNYRMWWDKATIKSHLYNAHDKMMIEHYETKYMSNYAEKEIIPQTSNWANKCIFKCSICEMEVNSRRTFEYHLKTKHNLVVGDYTKEHGKTLSYEKKHSCQIENCFSFFWWDKLTIKSHLYNAHDKMTIEHYEEKYMSKYKEKKQASKATAQTHTHLSQDRYSECQFSCNICKPQMLFHSRSKAGHHMKAVHKINLKNYKEQYGSSVIFRINHICQICAGVVLWDKDGIRSHLYNVHESIPIEEYFNKYIDNATEENEWLNKITFRCKECPKHTNKFLSRNRLELWEHVKDAHSMSEMEYRTIHGSIYGPDLPASHTCQVCSANLNWESISLKPHIELKHEMTAEQYVDKFKDSYAEKSSVLRTSPRLIIKREYDGIQTRSSVRQLEPSLVQELESSSLQQVESKSVQELEHGSVHQEDSTEDEEVLKWTAGSLYLCKVCKNAVPGLDQFKKHLTIRHNLEYKQYERTHQSKEYILFAGFHICKICNKNVKHDGVFLRNHMKEHDLTIRQYMDQYKPKPPKLERLKEEKRNKN